jgi:hypothetical protein
MRRLAFLALLLCAAVRAQGAVISQKAERVTVTLYHVGGPGQRDEGLAQVTETRTVDLTAGANQIRFRGVAATMVPQTAEVAGLPGLAEQNFDFNLLSPGALLRASVGKTVQLVRSDRNGETREQATVRSGPAGVVLETATGVQTLGCSGQPERLVFDGIPAELFDTPTLSANAVVPRAGRYRLTLRYLATGLTWAANYVARINPGGRTLTLSGWVTLTNASESGFGDAPVQVVAGAPSHDEEQDVPPALPEAARFAGCWQTDIDWASHYQAETVRQRLAGLSGGDMMGFSQPTPVTVMDLETVNSSASRIGEPFNLGDYKLYALPEPTTLAARQTKQLQFLDQRKVSFRRVYRVSGGYEDENSGEQPATVHLRAANTRAGGLGKPLPAGRILMLGPASGATVLMGEMSTRDIPVGLPLDIAGRPYFLSSGQTMAVSARGVTVKNESRMVGEHRRDTATIEVTATNHKNAPVDFEWCQSSNWEGLRITAEERRHEARDDCWLWPIRLKAGGQAHFRYTVAEGD